MSTSSQFADFSLPKTLLHTLKTLGYESPSPVQEKSIPILLTDQDLIAQAQTGTGKTAAFALPILAKLALKQSQPQALVLAPTRELAIQVAEAFQRYATELPDFHIVPIYGGQEYRQQIRALKRGVHVVVGTPGRVMDHIRRGSLDLTGLKTLVLDEADEMLKMGFLEDVQWILEHIPQEHQTALFSATMPPAIQQVAKAHLQQPEHVKIKTKTMTATSINQQAMLVSHKYKLEGLTRYLEVEATDGVIIFSRTKNMTTELADKLCARGYAAAALNGDMNQAAREKIIERLKESTLDIVVATDVAARGLDVERLNHVINYDAPYDAETYVHRIGRTGRAGREGKSLLILTPRERHFLKTIERTTKQPVEQVTPPTLQQLSDSRVEDFTVQLRQILDAGRLSYYLELVEKMAQDTEHTEKEIAAALLKMAQREKPLRLFGSDSLIDEPPKKPKRKRVRQNHNQSGFKHRKDQKPFKKKFNSKRKKAD